MAVCHHSRYIALINPVVIRSGPHVEHVTEVCGVKTPDTLWVVAVVMELSNKKIEPLRLPFRCRYSSRLLLPGMLELGLQRVEKPLALHGLQALICFPTSLVPSSKRIVECDVTMVVLACISYLVSTAAAGDT